MTKKTGDSNINFFLDKKDKAKFAAGCKLRGLVMTDLLKAEVKRYIKEWEAEKQPVEIEVPKEEPKIPSIPDPRPPTSPTQQESSKMPGIGVLNAMLKGEGKKK